MTKKYPTWDNLKTNPTKMLTELDLLQFTQEIKHFSDVDTEQFTI
jgi:hypothetical protein